MKTSPSFESQSSFEEFDTSTLNESAAAEGADDAALEMDWGVVSTTGSDVGTYAHQSMGTTSEYTDTGILIIDGIDSGSSRNDHPSDLSLPGTESLPSDLGSLSAENNDEVHNDASRHSAWVISKRAVYLAGIAAFLVFSVVTGLFIRQHYQYRSTMQQLGEKIQQLEKEREEMPQPVWMDGSDISSDSKFFTLLDNCWIKARMKVKFGDCSQNSYGLCGAFFQNATETIGKWFGETFASLDGGESSTSGSNQEMPSLNEAMETMAKFPGIMGEAIVSASKAVSEKIASLNLGLESEDGAADELIRASEAFAEALHSAGGAMASELNDLGEDPIKYLTEAVGEASQPARNAKFSMSGLRNVVEKVSAASIGWGEALVQTGETISVKVIEMMDDPLSYFEFQTKSSKEKEL